MLDASFFACVAFKIIRLQMMIDVAVQTIAILVVY